MSMRRVIPSYLMRNAPSDHRAHCNVSARCGTAHQRNVEHRIGAGTITKGALPRGNPDEPRCHAFSNLAISVPFGYNTRSIAPRNGYTVGKYVSIEAEIELTKETCYESLAASSVGWNEGLHKEDGAARATRYRN